ncbi:hypothetical protein L5M28_07390 [Shewanella sp. SW32]|uniref:hypothetical protein n=1 Tax=unclassified Shewanella TaxID=196818 RepID=UPI0021DB6538|nr:MULTISPECIES: hypothetical protein [unclassified Shewanella]MCU7962401.1 hypothetical protein [Shewanella sp. SW32]MCU7969257.1 hypothetical protein [Shewanella sp. SW29]
MSLTIGIDPDLKASGVAIVVRNKISELKNMPFPELIEYITALAADNEITVKLEDVNAWSSVKHRAGTGPAAMRKISQNVGQVKAVATLIKQSLNSKGIEVHLVKPLRGEVKMQAKKNSAYFNKLTGWTGRSNEDNRDAALIALHG